MKNPNRLQFLQIIVCVGLLVGIFFSFELWFPITRTFPRVPLFFEVPILFDQILTIILIVSLISLIFFQKLKIFLMTAIVSLILLIIFDQMRLQPWVYQYLLLLVIFALTDDEPHSNQMLGLAQIVIAGLYFWSGVQKLNFTFAYETLPILLAPLQNLFPSIRLPFVFLGISIALLEILIGIGLFFRKTRTPAVYFAAAMHAAILILLIAKNYNSIVWIWNATLILIVVVSFWQSENSIKQTIKTAFDWKGKFAKSIVAASVLLPVLSFWNLWDMYLSGALYSGNVEIAVIKINEDLFNDLPPKARQVVFQTQNTGDKILPLFEWSIAELNVPVYPENRIFKQITRQVCKSANRKSDVELIIKERPAILDGSYKLTRIDCRQIE
ncbi:hypothetical protein BH20ACI4_BH20ACI4_23740 [soil metagenome]